MVPNNNDLNLLWLSNTKATIVQCILELGFTIFLDSCGIFWERLTIYVEVDYGDFSFFSCANFGSSPPLNSQLFNK